jgi:preprotein translocase subunit SecG
MDTVILVIILMIAVVGLIIWLVISSRKKNNTNSGNSQNFLGRKVTIPTSFGNSNSNLQRRQLNPGFQRPM